MADSIRVLHVDDEPDFGDTVASFLEREDRRLRVDTATSASEGIDRLSGGDVDCIVSDYDMPETNGLEFLEAVRQDHPDLPFILFTGQGSEAVASEAISAGVTDYLQKETGTEQYQLLAKRIIDAVDHRYAASNYREIFEKVPDGIVVQDPGDGSFVDMNDEYADMFGYEREELLDADFEVIHPDEDGYTLANARQQIRDAAETGPRTIEWPGVRKDGTEFWAEVHLTPTRLNGRERMLAVVRDITERVEQERKREQIIDRVTDAIVEVDADWQFTLVNEQAEELYGMDEAYLQGRGFWDVFAEARGTRFEAEYRGVMDTREPTSFVEYYAGLDGWFEVQVFPNADGGLAFYFHEVSERRERKRELERYERILDRLPVGVFRSTTDGAFVDMNATFVSLLGADSREAAMAVDASEFYADPSVRQQLTSELRREGTVTDRDVRIETLAGETIWVSATLTLTELGDEQYIDGISQDITDQKERERELERYETIVDTVPDGVYVLDTDARFVLVNDALAELTGYTREELLGAHASRVFDAGTVGEGTRPPPETGTDRFAAYDTEVQRADGERVPCEIRGQELSGPGVDRPHGTVGVIRDITERKRHERQLERQNERLEEFTSVVSHDLRNPLSVADGRLELAREEYDSPHLDSAADAVDRSLALIDELLTLARDGRQVSDRETLPLSTLVRRSWQNVETGDATCVDESERTVHVDPNRFEQLLENLIRNAIEHNDATVTVTVGDTDDGFYVADDGAGIPEGDRERVFDPGYTTRDHGTGFGLNIVEQITEAHGWDVRVTESTDGGARFEFTGVAGAGRAT